MVNASPSQNPANTDSMTGLFAEILKKFLQGVDDMLPAQVIAYDRATNMAQVQPMVMVVTTAGQRVSRGQIANIPVFQLGAGGYMLNFPLKNGDLGWIKATDRDISLFLQSGGEASPQTARMHSFSDSVFFPQVLRDFTIAPEDADNVVLQTVDGAVRVSLSPTLVKVTAPTLHTTGDLQVDGHITVGQGITTGTTGAGDIVASGNIVLNGSMEATGEVTANTIPLSTHHHGGVQTGGGNTGGPAA